MANRNEKIEQALENARAMLNSTPRKEMIGFVNHMAGENVLNNKRSNADALKKAETELGYTVQTATVYLMDQHGYTIDQLDGLEPVTLFTLAEECVDADVKAYKASNKGRREPAPKGRYGHRVGTMANAIDDLLAMGTTRENAVETLVNKFGKTEKRINTLFASHVAFLGANRGIPVEMDENGVYKATLDELPEGYVVPVQNRTRNSTAKEKGRYGHRVGTMANAIDDLLAMGTTEQTVVEMLMEAYGKTEKRARTLFRTHTAFIRRDRGVPVNKDENGVYYAELAQLPEQA